jgi:hypothetical protein
MEEASKIVNIIGTHNKYQMKKIINKEQVKKEPKKRVVAENWTFSNTNFEYTYQINMVKDILNIKINDEKTENNIIKIAIQEIKKKISSYKQQDILKKKLDINKFITFEEIIKKMVECELMCRYCKENMNVLYDISREMKQWSVDRIDNNLGHNIDNFYLSCLDCNLKKRRQTDEKFLFTKQLKLIKKDT